jgi:hypothetical protein
MTWYAGVKQEDKGCYSGMVHFKYLNIIEINYFQSQTCSYIMEY